MTPSILHTCLECSVLFILCPNIDSAFNKVRDAPGEKQTSCGKVRASTNMFMKWVLPVLGFLFVHLHTYVHI